MGCEQRLRRRQRVRGRLAPALLLLQLLLLVLLQLRSADAPAPAAPTATAASEWVTLSWDAVAGADTYEVQEWSWDGIANGWYSSREAAAGWLGFQVNFGGLELPLCGRTDPTPLTSLRLIGRGGLRMEWRVRGLFNDSRDAGSWSAASNSLLLPEWSSAVIDDSCCLAGWHGLGSDCSQCPGGSVSSAGSAACTACPTGQFAEGGTQVAANAWVAATACSGCPAGAPDHDADASTPCVPCTRGRAQPLLRANTSCMICAAGSFAAAVGATACENCSRGEYAGIGASSCTPCNPGSTDDDGSPSTPCILCGAGRAGAGGAAPCPWCPAGRYSLLAGSVTCDRCAAGQFSPAQATGCTICPAGQSDHDRNSSTPCEWCTEGRWSLSGRSGVCPACGAGSIAVSPGSHSCAACHVGQVASASRTSCINCTVGRADTDRSAATPCDICEEGRFDATNRTAHEWADECTACPTGYWSDPETTACWNDTDPYRGWSLMDFFMAYCAKPLAGIVGALVGYCVYKFFRKHRLVSRCCSGCCGCLTAALHMLGCGCVVELGHKAGHEAKKMLACCKKGLDRCWCEPTHAFARREPHAHSRPGGLFIIPILGLFCPG